MRRIGELIEILRKKPYPEKLRAIEELKNGQSPEYASVLINGLYDLDTRVRKAVSEALISLGAVAFNPLVSGLKTQDRTVRRNILLILEKINEQNPSLASKMEEVLLNCLKDPDPVVKVQAGEILGKMKSKSAIPFLLSFLTDINFWVRSLGALVLGDLGLMADELTLKQVIDSLIERLRDVNPWVRRSACESLGKLKAKEAVDKISELALTDPSDIVQDATIDALKAIGTISVAPFQKALSSSDIKERMKGMTILIKLGEITLPALLPLLTSEDINLKTIVCSILGQIGSPQAAEHLIQLLRTERGNIQILVINALSQIKEERVVKYLISFLSHPDPALSDEAQKGLERMGEYVVPFLLSELNNQDAQVRRRVCEVLGNIGTEKVAYALAKKMSDENPWVRAAVCSALGKIGNKEITPYLIIALKDHSPLVRAQACEALRLLHTSYGIAELTARVKDDDLSVKVAALKALTEIKGEEVKPIVMEALKDEDVEMRIAAIQALGQLEAIETLPLLEKIAQPWPLSREDDAVKEVAQIVIKKFKGIIAYHQKKRR